MRRYSIILTLLLLLLAVSALSSCKKTEIADQDSNPNVDGLTVEDFQKIQKGMSISKVVEMLGYPGEDVGSMYTVHQYFTWDGQRVQITYIENEKYDLVVTHIAIPGLKEPVYLSQTQGSLDSREITEEYYSIIEQYNLWSQYEYTLKIYEHVPLACLATQTIDELLKTGEQWIRAFSEDDIDYLRLNEEGKIEATFMPFYHSWNKFDQYARNPKLLFGETVSVDAVYCLDNGDDHGGSSIYYVTDHGDYILHQEQKKSEAIYLFPLEDLLALFADNNVENGNYGYVSDLTNVEQYIIDLDNPPEFPPLPAVEEDRHGLPWQWILPGGAVLILGTAAAIYLWHKKKKV